MLSDEIKNEFQVTRSRRNNQLVTRTSFEQQTPNHYHIPKGFWLRDQNEGAVCGRCFQLAARLATRHELVVLLMAGKNHSTKIVTT